jgi:uncharacterized protein (DUF305 family)
LTTRTKILGAILSVALLGLGVLAGALLARPSVPSEDSADVGFARDMSEHHAQAVEMGMIAYQNAVTPAVRTLGGDIALTQQGQFGMMQAWLRDWGYGPTGEGKPMAWMKDGESYLDGNRMPGMATREEINQLRSAKGKDLDILFLQLMLRHHVGGRHMIDGALAEASDPEVLRLAEQMKQTQGTEVAVIEGMLKDLGAKPL